MTAINGGTAVTWRWLGAAALAVVVALGGNWARTMSNEIDALKAAQQSAIEQRVRITADLEVLREQLRAVHSSQQRQEAQQERLRQLMEEILRKLKL